MPLAPRARAALKVPLLALPLLCPWLLPEGLLPPGPAYASSAGRWLVIVGVAGAFVSVALHGRRLWFADACARRLTAAPWWPLPIAVWVAALLLMLAVIPQHRWPAARFTGDEPKYLRIADSLYHDVDVDLASGSTAPVTGARLRRGLRVLTRSTAAAAVALWRDPFPEVGAHRWNLGNWALAGRHGGRYRVQSPGLPALLLPSRLLQPFVDPQRPYSLALVTLALLWSLTVVQTALLAVEVSGSRAAGLAAGLGVTLAAPFMMNGFHFYPEAGAAAAVPWLARFVRGTGRLHPARSVCLGLVAGALPWLHPKFALLSAVTLGLLAWRLRDDRASLAATLAAGALPWAALLLFHHHVTGLLRPDALYVRYAAGSYTGLTDFMSTATLTGLQIALVGGRDGILVMAPLLLAAVFCLPILWRRERGTFLVLAALFASVWFAAAVHEGGAPGPPGRLMTPVACLGAVPLAVGLRELRGLPAFRWTTVALALVTASVSVTMLQSWRRSVYPYEGMFASQAVNFARELPAGPRSPEDALKRRPGRELLRGTLVLAAIGLWTWFFGRRSRRERNAPPADLWAALCRFHAAAWATLGVLSWGLHQVPL